MKTTHPMVGVWGKTEIPAALAEIVKGLPELPRIEQKARVEWEKDGTSAPAGTYTDPNGAGVDDAVRTVLAGGKFPRRVLAVALNFRTTHDLQIVRGRIDAIARRAPKAVEPAPAPVEAPTPPAGSRPAKRAAKKAAAAA